MVRRSVALVGLSALAGCTLLVDLTDLTSDAGVDWAGGDAFSEADATSDAGPQDSGPQDSGPCADGAATVIENVNASNADTIIVQPNPTLNLGGLTIANVSTGIQSTALLRFTISAAAAVAFSAGRVVRADLTLTRAISDPGCSGTCPVAAGTLDINPLRTDWMEGDGNFKSGATWSTRNGVDAWAQAGALGVGADIAAVNESVIFDGGPLFVAATFPGSAFAGFIVSNQLAVRVGPSGGVAFVIATRENKTYTKPVLTLTYCP